MNVQQAAVSDRRLVHGLGSVGKLEVGRHRSIARQVKSIGLGAIGEFCVDAREAVDAQLTAKERAHLINVGALIDRIMAIRKRANRAKRNKRAKSPQDSRCTPSRPPWFGAVSGTYDGGDDLRIVSVVARNNRTGRFEREDTGERRSRLRNEPLEFWIAPTSGGTAISHGNYASHGIIR